MNEKKASETEKLFVNEKDIKHYTSCIGSVLHPIKGRILFAKKSFNKNEVIAELNMDDIKLLLLPNIEEYKKYLKSKPNVKQIQKCIEHSVPTGNGKILIPNSSHWNNYFNHSMEPNVFTTGEFYTKQKWKHIAIKDIKYGDELTQDYNQSSGYEVRGNEQIVKQFLDICKQYNVEKRPSKLTLPPVKVKINTQKSSKL